VLSKPLLPRPAPGTERVGEDVEPGCRSSLVKCDRKLRILLQFDATGLRVGVTASVTGAQPELQVGLSKEYKYHVAVLPAPSLSAQCQNREARAPPSLYVC